MAAPSTCTRETLARLLLLTLVWRAPLHHYDLRVEVRGRTHQVVLPAPAECGVPRRGGAGAGQCVVGLLWMHRL